MRRRTWIGLGAAVGLAAACASQPVHNQVAPSATLQAAEQAGAAQDERAAKYLALAREDLAAVERNGVDSSRGERALQRASVDSELALALAQNATQQAEARESQRKVNELKAQQAANQGETVEQKNATTIEDNKIAVPRETPDEAPTPDDMKPITPEPPVMPEQNPPPPADRRETP